MRLREMSDAGALLGLARSSPSVAARAAMRQFILTIFVLCHAWRETHPAGGRGPSLLACCRSQRFLPGQGTWAHGGVMTVVVLVSGQVWS